MRSRFTIVSEGSLPSQKDQRSYFAKRPLKVIDDPFVTSSSSFVFLKKTSNRKREREKKIADEEVEERMEEKRENRRDWSWDKRKRGIEWNAREKWLVVTVRWGDHTQAKESIGGLMVALMRIKYLEMMLFILVSGATPSISVSSVAPNRALSRSTLLCNLSISTSYWKRRDVALLVTRHTLAGSSVRRQVRETER